MIWAEAGWAVELGRLGMHFLWQASVIGILAAIVMECIPRSPRGRHAVLLVALGGLFVAPLCTWWFGRSELPPAEVLYGMATLPEPSPWLGASGVVWALGAIFQSLRTAMAFGSVRRLRTRGVEPASPAIVALVEELRASLAVTRRVGVFVSSLAQVPTVVGTLKPAVLLPAYALTSLSPAELRAVIAHELAHVRRFDDIVNWALAVAETLFFFHPAVWWIASRLRAEREFCCDDAAVEICGEPIVFARALERLETLRPARVPSQIALASQGGPLMQRIQRLVRSRTSQRRTPRTLLPIAATLVGLAWFSASASAASPFGPHDEKEVREIEEAIERIQKEITEIRMRIRQLDADDAAEDVHRQRELGLELLGGTRHRIHESELHAREVQRLLAEVEEARAQEHVERELHERHRERIHERHQAHAEKSDEDSLEFRLRTQLGKDGLLRIDPQLLDARRLLEKGQLHELKSLRELVERQREDQHKIKDAAKAKLHTHLMKVLEGVEGARLELGDDARLLHDHLLELEDRDVLRLHDAASKHAIELGKRLSLEAPKLREHAERLHRHLGELEKSNLKELHERLSKGLNLSLREHGSDEQFSKHLHDALRLYQGSLRDLSKGKQGLLEQLHAQGLELGNVKDWHDALEGRGLKLKEMAEKLHKKSKLRSEHDAALEQYHRALQERREAENAEVQKRDKRKAEIERLERALKRLQEEV